MADYPQFEVPGQVALVGRRRALAAPARWPWPTPGPMWRWGLRDIQADRASPPKITALGRRALRLQMDVTHLDQIEAAVAAAVAHFGRLDILVNNAGARAEQPRRGGARGGFRLHGCRQPEGYLLRQPGGRAGDDRAAVRAYYQPEFPGGFRGLADRVGPTV